MPTVNEYLQQEMMFAAYKALRDAPRDTIRDRLVRVSAECLQQYDELQVALAGGDGGRLPDISPLAEQFATVTAPVTPFVTLLQYAMRLIIATPKLVDQAATAGGMMIAPFGVDTSTPVTPEEYAELLQDAAAAIVAVGHAAQSLEV